MKREIVYVEFMDHEVTQGWRKDSTLNHSGYPCIGAGIKLYEDDTFLVLGGMVGPEQDSSSRVHIVKSTITKRKRLKF